MAWLLLRVGKWCYEGLNLFLFIKIAQFGEELIKGTLECDSKNCATIMILKRKEIWSMQRAGITRAGRSS